MDRVYITLEMRTLMPACLLSHPNSLIVSPACSVISFLIMYSLYFRLLDALCNHAAPHNSSSCIRVRAASVPSGLRVCDRPSGRLGDHTHTHTYLEAVNVAVEWADRSSKAGAIRSPVLVGKLENLKRKKKTTIYMTFIWSECERNCWPFF